MEMLNKWKGNARRLERIGLGISGKFFPVIPILPPEDEIGYTSEKKAIHLLAHKHPIIKDLDEKHQIVFITGVYAHELMHQLETDFQEFASALDKVAIPELFKTIVNIIEDPAIEYWAPHYFGGPLLKSLRYSIMHLYRDSNEIAVAVINGEKVQLDPITQFVNAVVQYGDGGLLKGKFASKEAENAFRKALPIIDQAIVEPSGKVRISLCLEVYRIVESFVDVEAYQKAKETLQDLLKELGKNIESIPANKSERNPIGDEKKDPIPGGQIDAKKFLRREQTAGKIGAEHNKDEQKKSFEKENDSINDPTSKKNGESDSSATEKETDTSTTNPNDSENEAPGGNPTDDCSGTGIDLEKENVIDYDSYELTEEDIKEIANGIDKVLKEELREREKENAYNAEKLPDFQSINNEYKGVRVLNRQISGKSNEELLSMYNDVISSLSGGINQLASQLKRIIQNDREDRDYRCSGRLNVNRYRGSRVTARVFDKHIEPRNVSNMAVLILVDCSGSMSTRNKCQKAQRTAIGLAEALSKVKIPFKVIGFHADQMGYHVVQDHFVNFRDSVLERAKLLNLTATGNNFDGYSIRYGSELLSKRPEEHKLMFVISDGQPACGFYTQNRPGVADTMRAVRCAQKKVHVIGLAIDANVNVLHTIYRNDFVVVKHADSLLNIIGKKIQKEMRK